MDILGAVNEGVSYARNGLHFVKDLLTKIAGFIPVIDADLAVAIVFLLFSLWLSYFIVKKFVTKPLSGSYIIWTFLISISIYLNLSYL